MSGSRVVDLADALRDRYRFERELRRGGMATVWGPVLVLMCSAVPPSEPPELPRPLSACAAHEKMTNAGASARPSERDGYVRTPDGVNLYYCVIGEGPDTIVTLHGGAGLDMGYMIPGLLPLAREHAILFYDQRGAGRSTVVKDSTAINISAHIADLEALRRSFGFQRMILLGHSWGAMLAARFAVRYPQYVTRLVLVDAGPLRRSPYFQQFLTNATGWMDSTTRLRFETLSAALDTASQPVPVCRAWRELWLRGLLANRTDTLLLAQLVTGGCTAPIEALHNRTFVGRLTMQSLGDWDWRGDFGRVSAPVLIVQGDGDPIPMASAHEWRRAFRDARLLVVEGAGHYSYADRPEAFADAVRKFLH